MATGRSLQLTKQVGEYLVAAELCRRGFIAATFSGNVPHYDIIATNKAGQSVPVQVKAITRSSWQFDIRRFVDVRLEGKRQVVGRLTPAPPGNVVCVCVALGGYGQDRFYVLPWTELERIAAQGHRAYLRKHSGVRPRKHDSFHTAVQERDLAPYRDNWQLVTDRLEAGG